MVEQAGGLVWSEGLERELVVELELGEGRRGERIQRGHADPARRPA